MIIKKFVLILIFFFLVNCGYQPIYSNKSNLQMSFNEIELEGNKNINRKIISLGNIKLDKKKSSLYDLQLKSNKIVEVMSKDKSGNDSVYRLTVTTNLILKDKGNVFKSKDFTASFSYNTMSNKFDLSRYQKNIEKDLIIKISEEILIYLSF